VDDDIELSQSDHLLTSVSFGACRLKK